MNNYRTQRQFTLRCPVCGRATCDGAKNSGASCDREKLRRDRSTRDDQNGDRSGRGALTGLSPEKIADVRVACLRIANRYESYDIGRGHGYHLMHAALLEGWVLGEDLAKTVERSKQLIDLVTEADAAKKKG